MKKYQKQMQERKKAKQCSRFFAFWIFLFLFLQEIGKRIGGQDIFQVKIQRDIQEGFLQEISDLKLIILLDIVFHSKSSALI